MKCQVCGKAGMFGSNVSHSKRHTKTRFLANVHKSTIPINGTSVKVKICTRCLRTLYKLPKVKA